MSGRFYTAVANVVGVVLFLECSRLQTIIFGNEYSARQLPVLVTAIVCAFIAGLRVGPLWSAADNSNAVAKFVDRTFTLGAVTALSTSAFCALAFVLQYYFGWGVAADVTRENIFPYTLTFFLLFMTLWSFVYLVFVGFAVLAFFETKVTLLFRELRGTVYRLCT